MAAVLACIAERFPQAFVPERYLPHRPLKIGIHIHLKTRCPALSERERSAVLRYYVARLMYLRACVAGAPRIAPRRHRRPRAGRRCRSQRTTPGKGADPGGGEGPGPSNTAIRPRAAPVARRRRQSLSPTPTIINLKGVFGQWAR